MDTFQLIQFVTSLLMPFILWLLNVSYQRAVKERAEILDILHETRDRQNKIEERLYKVELELEIRSEAPTHMRRPIE